MYNAAGICNKSKKKKNYRLVGGKVQPPPPPNSDIADQHNKIGDIIFEVT